LFLLKVVAALAKFVFKALVAGRLFALFADFQATSTEAMITVLANVAAFAAQRNVTLIARSCAVVARATMTVFAAVTVTGIDHLSAIAAGDSIPVFECDVRRRRIVGLEDLANCQKEVTQSTCCEGVVNGMETVTHTQILALNVGMGNVVIAARRVAFNSHDSIGLSFPDAGDGQSDLELTEVNPFENHSISKDHNLFQCTVDIDLDEFICKRLQLLIQESK